MEKMSDELEQTITRANSGEDTEYHEPKTKVIVFVSSAKYCTKNNITT